MHVHLEGSIRPASLLTLAARNHVLLPADTVEGLQEWFVYSGFDHFIEVYLTIARCLRTSDDYELVVYEFGAEMARQNVRYAEVTFTPGNHYSLGMPQKSYFAGLKRGREKVQRDFGVEINWVFDINRSSDLADYTTSVAIEGIDDGVIALGLGGPEVGYPPELFVHSFDRARAAGLHSVPHAGETVGPASIWGALRALGAERIGHGVRAVEDPDLVSYLAESHIPLEICPASNVCLGTYATLTDHPLRQLYERGVTITINSDDPPLFNTSLNDEVLSLSDPFGFDTSTIEDILLNAVRQSFLPVTRKQALESAFRSEMTQLRASHLADV